MCISERFRLVIGFDLNQGPNIVLRCNCLWRASITISLDIQVLTDRDTVRSCGWRACKCKAGKHLASDQSSDVVSLVATSLLALLRFNPFLVSRIREQKSLHDNAGCAVCGGFLFFLLMNIHLNINRWPKNRIGDFLEWFLFY